MAIPDKAITRGEQYLAAMAGQSGTLPDEPITRKEFYLAKAAGQAVETPEPITREEMYLDVIAEGGGGGGGDANAVARSLLNGTATEYIDDEITLLRDGAFYGSAATTIRCHAVTKIGTATNGNTFYQCAVTRLAFPNLVTGYRSFEGAFQLTAVDLGASYARISAAEFFQCTKLNTLVLRKADGVVSLASTNSFNGTPFAQGKSGGTIYIPQSLYAHLGDGSALDYKAATNWSTYDGYGTVTWAPIEGSIYETQYADGTAVS